MMASHGGMASGGVRMLPHQLVPRDQRSSYIPRVETLAGPGAYAIPSTFTRSSVNAQMRVIHNQCYGREFASQQRRQTASEENHERDPHTQHERTDRYQRRRERLRELLEDVLEQRKAAHDVDAATVASPPKTEVVLPLSPSLSCTSNYDVFVEGYRQHRTRSRSRDTSSSLASPTSPTTASVCDLDFHVYSPSKDHDATQKLPGTSTSSTMTRLSYRDYLSTTSYHKRLRKQRPQTSPRRQVPPSSPSTQPPVDEGS